MRKILFYDPDITGHHCEYLRHPARFISEQRECSGVIVCNKIAGEPLEAEYGVENSQLGVDCIDVQSQQLIDGAQSLWDRGKADAKCFAASIEKHQPDLAIALHANPLQPFLNGRSFRRGKTRIRGILFDPFPLAERLGRGGESFKVRLTRIRKNCQVRWFARNQNIEKMFVLNDTKIASYLNAITGQIGRFEAVPDPIPLHLSAGQCGRALGASNELKSRLLFIGSINRRKGLVETLDAVSRLDAEEYKRFILRIVGRFTDAALREEAIPMIHRLQEQGVEIEFREGWVSNEDFAYEMSAANLVLIPYVGFHGSSGVLGHASYCKKSILATSEGLVGEIVGNRKIGELVQVRDPELYAGAIRRYLESPWDHSSSQDIYAAEMSSDSFMNQLIG